MSSNGISNSSTIPQDIQSGNQQGRYARPGNRRGRGRGGQDRGGSTRGYRRSNYREQTNRNTTSNTGVIDIHDSTQWPSIQESSNGVHTRPKNPPQQDRAMESASVNSDKDERIPYEGRRSSYQRFQFSGQNTGVPGSSGNQVRDYGGGGRYPSSRSRGQRYSQNRGYQNNYQRRYVRGGFPTFGPVYGRESNLVPNFFNGQIIFQAYPNVNISAPDSRPTSIVDPVKQVEYYFSAGNLETDIFMRTQMDKDGWVDLRIIHQFKRISNLNLPLDVFIDKLLISDKLEVNVEDVKVRTRLEPEKWYLPEGKSIAPPKTEIPVTHPSAGYDQYGAVGFSPMGAPYGTLQPMFIPFQGYPRGSRGRYFQQYSMYPTAYTGFPYESQEGYYYQGEAMDQYGIAEQAGNFNYGGVDGREAYADNQYYQMTTHEDVNASQEQAQEIIPEVESAFSKDVESLSQDMSKLDIEKDSTQ